MDCKYCKKPTPNNTSCSQCGAPLCLKHRGEPVNDPKKKMGEKGYWKGYLCPDCSRT